MPIEENDGPPTEEMILDRMQQYEIWQNTHLIEYQVRRTFYATNARFNLESTLEVQTVFQAPDLFDSQVVRSEGSTLIREEVFDKFLDAEKEAHVRGATETAVTLKNYHFEEAAAENCGGRTCYRLKITPKRKDKFLLEGQIWVDAEDGAITRVQGSPASQPSFWTQHTEIDRRYERIDGVWLCKTILATSDILIGGLSTLRIDYDYISVLTQTRAD